MANWCYNTITFSGRYKNFAKQLEKHNYEALGFEIIKDGKSRCIFQLEKIDDGMYSFESKWCPPLDELTERARKGRFSFEIDYEELANGIYGRAYFDPSDGLHEYNLPQETLDRRSWDDNGECLCIDGILCDSDHEMEWLENELELLIKENR